MIDCHMHMVLDGVDWKHAICRHRERVDVPYIHSVLKKYQEKGYTWLRDGGDKWGVGSLARSVSAEYGITYRTPLAPICKAGHYGSFIGVTYETEKDYVNLIKEHRQAGADFIKIMISGLMDFDRFGVLTESGLEKKELRQLIHIAHQEGFSVMAHGNGSRTVTAAAEAGVDSIEHGAYLDEEALCAMKENKTVWVPTLSTIGNLRGTGRFAEAAVEQILESALQNVSCFYAMGGLLAEGSDAGAWAVPHGCNTEKTYFAMAGLPEGATEPGNFKIMEKF